MKDEKINLVFNTTEGTGAIEDSTAIRREALMGKIPYATTMEGAFAIAKAIRAVKATTGGFDITPMQAYQKAG